ncbi:MAG: hypothetical protein QG602_1560 [Verrucomicrobiota bacterium]|nr:hypothetical protein [Verrucomicrobiota bacterium]
MKILFPLFAIGALLLGTNIAEAKITRVVEKTFAVQPGGNLKASTQGGDITIRTADTPQVHVQVKQVVRASSEQEADEILEKLTLTLEQTGNDVTAEAKYEKRGPGTWFGNWPPVSVSFVITVPTSYNLNLGTSGGDIGVASLKGNVRARTSGGDLEFARIDGDIDAGTSGGDITLLEGTARARLTTSGGDISVDRAGGLTEVSTSGGDIELKSVAQLVSASTSGGDVHAVITGPIAQDALLSTSGGQVRVEIAKDTGFHLDASTSGGDVRADGITITIEKGGSGKSRLMGAVNGGGPRLKLRSSGGDIKVTSR